MSPFFYYTYIAALRYKLDSILAYLYQRKSSLPKLENNPKFSLNNSELEPGTLPYLDLSFMEEMMTQLLSTESG